MIATVQDAVELVRQGNNEGKAFLYEHTYKRAYYIALKYVKSDDDAFDIVQDSYIKAFDRIAQLEDALKFEGWLNTIVASTAMDSLKKKKPQLFTDMSGDDEEYDVADRFEADYSQQPEVVMDQNETSRLVQEIIGELSDEQRVCVTMYYMQEMSVKEISSVLDVSDNTVKSRLNYARKNIEAKIKELEKKGTKLYALAPIPFFVFLLGKEASACEAASAAGLYSATAVASVGAGGTTSTVTGATVSSATGASGASAAGAAAGIGASSGVTATGVTLGVKVAIGITAGVLAIGGAVGVGIAVSNATDDMYYEMNKSDDEDSWAYVNASTGKKLPSGAVPVEEKGGCILRITSVVPQDNGDYIATVENLNTNVLMVTEEEYSTYQIGVEKVFGDYVEYVCYKADDGYYFKAKYDNDMITPIYWISDQHKYNNNIVVYSSGEGEEYHPSIIDEYKSKTNSYDTICISEDAMIELVDKGMNESAKKMYFKDFVSGNVEGEILNGQLDYLKNYLSNVIGWKNLGHFILYGDNDGYVVRLHERGYI